MLGSHVDQTDDQSRELRSFGRRRGRKLSPRQETLMRELLPRVRVDLGRPLVMASDPKGPAPALWLEIGFGGAEHLIWQAAHNPHVTIIGCEPFEEGIVKALAAIDDKRLDNVRLHPDDARPLLRWLPPQSLSRCFILFPDPWPKKRHAKRRLVTPATLAWLARIMKPGAELRIGTDIGPYARTVLAAIWAEGHFEWTATGPADWRMRPDDWPQTRYEAKGLREGRRCYFLRFVRSERP
jgi:tRNA (guanine-N7-)-methyltransferase